MDIVEWLREQVEQYGHWGDPEIVGRLTEAADEIERLRAQVAERDQIIARLAPPLDIPETLAGDA